MKNQQKVNWVLTTVKLTELKQHSKNPRQIVKEKFERLTNLIDKFGLIDKPIVNHDLTIIGGHQRVKYLKKKKVKTIECWVSDRLLTDDEIDELCIGLNLHQGTWDWDVLANEWEPLDLLKYGFSEEQLIGTCEEAEEILVGQKEKKDKKKKNCPNCGHEL